MGISRITAMSIANNIDNVGVAAFGPCDVDDDPPNVKGKFGGSIYWIDHPHHPGAPLLSSNCVYDSAEEAKAAMQGIIDELAPKADELNRELRAEMERIEGSGS